MKKYLAVGSMLMVMAMAGAQLVAGTGQGTMQGSMPPKQGGSMQGSMMTDHSATEKALIANENAVNDAFAKKDLAKIKSFIADDAMMADMSGSMMAADIFKQLPTMDFMLAQHQLSNFKFVWADDSTAVLSYTWTGKGTYMGQPMPSPVFCSTVWTKRGTKWVAVYHQETAAAAPMMKK